MAAIQDVVIIGGGHNGLVTAFYLARAGRKPLVLELRPLVGGAAVTDAIAPGFKCPTLSHATGPLRAQIAREMALERHGVQMIEAAVRLFSPSPDGRALVLHGDPARSAREILHLSKKDADRYVDFHQTIGRLAGALGGLLTMTPPSLDAPSLGDLLRLLSTGRKVRGLGKKDMFRLLRWGPMAVADLVAEWFETELLRATIAARGIFGAFAGPWSAGTSTGLLWQAAMGGNALGSASFIKGGMGTLTQALAKAAFASGVEISTGAAVERIQVNQGKTSGVVLANGEEITARAVVSNADPRTTFLRLVDPLELDPDFLLKIRNYRALGTGAKINLALSGLPSFPTLSGGNAHTRLSGRIHIGPEIDYLERAFDAAKYGDYSPAPYMDITIPSVTDQSLTPSGAHVMSAYVQFAPYSLKHGD